jgi:hypothetical protein
MANGATNNNRNATTASSGGGKSGPLNTPADRKEPSAPPSTRTELQIMNEMRSHMDIHRQLLLQKESQLSRHGSSSNLHLLGTSSGKRGSGDKKSNVGSGSGYGGIAMMDGRHMMDTQDRLSPSLLGARVLPKQLNNQFQIAAGKEKHELHDPLASVSKDDLENAAKAAIDNFMKEDETMGGPAYMEPVSLHAIPGEGKGLLLAGDDGSHHPPVSDREFNADELDVALFSFLLDTNTPGGGKE